ncbi:MAG: hypothetical protein PVJ15_09110 [Gammaproteobacteria bacterium]|jgi:hypothetical protein
MRLLEFNKDEDGANPRRSAPPSQAAPPAPARAPRSHRPSETREASRVTHLPSGKAFPVEGNTLRKPQPRSPIDLEHLQQRMDLLEKRIQEQSANPNNRNLLQQLRQLQQRIKHLELTLDSELWAARQREHTMLELLNRPPFKELAKARLIRFRDRDLPVILAWLKRAARNWWLDSQPCWWPRFAQAWQESLDKARR